MTDLLLINTLQGIQKTLEEIASAMPKPLFPFPTLNDNQLDTLKNELLSETWHASIIPSVDHPNEAAGLRALNQFMNGYDGLVKPFMGNTDHNENDVHAALAVNNVKPAYLTMQILTLYLVAHGWVLDDVQTNDIWAVYINPLAVDYIGEPFPIVLPRNPSPRDPTVINYVTSALNFLQEWRKMPPINNPRVAGLLSIHDERERQDAKWGIQNHEPASYLSILTEEIGEASEAVNNIIFSGNDLANDVHRELFDQLNAELIQIAAVALAFVECNKRNYPFTPDSYTVGE